MAKFTYDDTVQVLQTAPLPLRPGALASVVMLHEGENRSGSHFDNFPPGVVYTIEFEDGASVEVHESLLIKGEFPDEAKNREEARRKV